VSFDAYWNARTARLGSRGPWARSVPGSMLGRARLLALRQMVATLTRTKAALAIRAHRLTATSLYQDGSASGRALGVAAFRSSDAAARTEGRVSPSLSLWTMGHARSADARAPEEWQCQRKDAGRESEPGVPAHGRPQYNPFYGGDRN
jgi:hypothetical protein